MTKLDNILKSRDITLPTKVHLVKAVVFPVVVYGCESWTMKKAKHQRIDAFGLWCWRGLLRVPWTARRSILGVHWRDWCWSWNADTLATRCRELIHLKRPWFWERLKAGGEGDDRGWDGWMASLTQWTWVWVNSRSWWWTGKPGMLRFMGSQRVRHDWATELNWAEIGVARMWLRGNQYIRWPVTFRVAWTACQVSAQRALLRVAESPRVTLRPLDSLPLGSEQGKTERMGWLVTTGETTWLIDRQEPKAIATSPPWLSSRGTEACVRDLEESSSRAPLAASPTAWGDSNTRSCQNAAQGHAVLKC